MSSLISKYIKPVSEDPVISVIDVRSELRVDYPLSDAILASYIKSSTSRIENLTALVLSPSEVTTVYKQYGCGDQIILGYFNGVDTTNPIDGMPDDGELDGAGEQWYMNTRAGKVTLKYSAGYETLPDWARQAIILDVAWRLEHYGDENIPDYSPQMMALIQPYKAYISL